MAFYPHNQQSQHLKAVLEYAARKVPVFPLQGKTPLTPNGFKDATTDASRIHMWWRRHPGANIGIPTGGISGMVVVDRDGDSPEAARIWESLPPTVEVSTLRGRHRYYRVPLGTKVKSRKLAPDLDLKADGGYVVAPPSVHPVDGSRYKFVGATKTLGVAALPDVFLVEPDVGRRDSRRREGSTSNTDDSGPIPEGTRNITLTSIAGRRRAEGLGSEDIEEYLLTVNVERCAPPLGADEVRRIAASVARYPVGNASPGPDPDTLEAIEDIQRAMGDVAWPGMGGKTERDVVIALLGIARRHGRGHDGGGVEVSISHRSLALAAAASRRATDSAVGRLMRKGWLRRGRNGSGPQAGTLVLLPRAKVDHSNHRESSIEANGCSGLPLRAPRLRWSGTTRVRVGDDWETFGILRLGKTAGAVVDVLDCAGGSATLEEIANTLRVSRPRDLRRRVIARLVERGIITVTVTVTGTVVTLVDDWMDALMREREASGEVDAARRDMDHYNRERAGYRNRHKVKAERSPTEGEMQERREQALERRRESLEGAIARLFRECPEYRRRRVGQITCAIVHYLPDDFPRAVDPGGAPKDKEVAAVLDANGCGVAA